jgi:hypothetical protein
MQAVEQGLWVIYIPIARLIHFEGQSLDIRLVSRHMQAWVACGDLYYNPNLLLHVVRFPAPWREGVPLERLKKIMDYSS